MELQMPGKRIVSDEEVLSAIREAAGNRTDAAKSLGVNIRTVQRRIQEMRQDGLLTHEPEIDGNIIRQSTLSNAQGEIVAQWDIRVPEKTKEAQEAALQAMKSEIVALPPQAQLQLDLENHLINHYTFSDSHIGLMVDEEYSSNLPETEELVASTFEKMVADSPRAKDAVLCILGDWFHFDGLLPVTPRGQNVLFSSAHYHDMVQSGVKIMRRLITSALFHHDKLTVVICEGNHDLASSYWLRTMFMALFEGEPRVKFVDSDDPFYAFQFGEVFLGYHHGHIKSIKNAESLTLLMATDYASVWGQTTKRYIHTGHLHHFEEKEVSGALVTQHPTLQGKDNHTRREGYRSGRAAVAHTYSNLHGKVGTTIVTPEMLLR